MPISRWSDLLVLDFKSCFFSLCFNSNPFAIRASLVSQLVKNPPAMQETLV